MKGDDMRRPITIIQRPPVCHDKAIPTLSWGEGLTPIERNKSKPLLAIAWDKVIKLMCVNDEKGVSELELELCGFYCSDQEISQVYFLADSVLAIVVNGEQVKVLSTDRFRQGDIHLITKNKQPLEVKKELHKMVFACRSSELEKGQKIRELKTRVTELDIEKTRQTAKFKNYDNTISINRRDLAFVCNDQVMLARVSSWEDFFEQV